MLQAARKPRMPLCCATSSRTWKVLAEMGDRHSFGSAVRFLDPVSYLDMIQLEANAK